MKKVCVEHLVPDMVLAKDVAGVDGSTVLEKGAALDEGAVHLLRELGQPLVYVRDRDPETEKRDLQRRVEQHVRSFFAYVDPDNEAFVELFRLSVSRCAQAAATGWSIPCEFDLRAKNLESMKDLFFRDLGSPSDIVTHETELASFPDIYFKIKEVLESPTSSAGDIAKVVSTDMGLTAKLLKLVNSPFYGLTTNIDSISRAVSLIGLKEVSTLALGISTISFFKDIPSELMDMKKFWKHSLSCGVFAKLVAGRVKLSGERFFTAGLLHDAGRLILLKQMSYASVQFLLFAREHQVPIVEAEREMLGYDHTDVGRLLLEAWRFPPFLTDLVAGHHSPAQAAATREAAILQLADNMANAAEICSENLYVLPGMDRESWDAIGLPSRDLEEIMALHDRNIDELTAVFL